MTSLAPPDLALDQYQSSVANTFPVEDRDGFVYLLDELNKTCQSLSEKLAPEIPPENRLPYAEVAKDLGYALRCLSALSANMGMYLSDVAQYDIEKAFEDT